MYARRCPRCGCYLDPCEPCDCSKEKTALDATNTQSGKVECEVTIPTSTSILPNT
jgi:hypothetical protein